MLYEQSTLRAKHFARTRRIDQHRVGWRVPLPVGIGPKRAGV